MPRSCMLGCGNAGCVCESFFCELEVRSSSAIADALQMYWRNAKSMQKCKLHKA